ncbi:unnamed protein product [Adineta steineri]|uniref:UDP-N-acetylglucosamine--peptide N-acetylglucosaminyltransferase SPINDLY n=1 Tax=Adineta steineri TaxID=433720 RepID=A0A815R6Z5_9BILA|nr:unnamed protein product [Adineta steineri]CAF3809048.1 unnamed protein product [Adineta steineri]
MANNESVTSAQTSTEANAKRASTFSRNTVENRRGINMKRMQSVLLIWLDSNINENNADYGNTIKQLKRVVNNVNTFTHSEECIEFIQTITDNKVCMIVSGELGKHVVPHVHDMSQVDTIFIFCNNQEWHKQWTKEWPKIKGVFTDITSICVTLKQTAHQCEQNAISISFVASNKKLDQLDPSFMYTQILKEILLTINFEDKHFKEFINYCRETFAENEHDLHNIEKLEHDYHNHIPIWWYTYECFLYRTLNCALRLMNADIIVRMGFFINDLHRDIQRLHSEQFDVQQSNKTFTVYRGQCLSKEAFTEMTNTKGGLLSFNNFLSTIGVLFVISINPTDSKIPFACVSDISYFHTEDEVLFSMHTVFRIGDIQSMDGNNHLYQVNLTLTNDNDEDLRTLTDRIRQETFPNSTGWYRLGELLIKMGQFTKAQEIYEVLLNQTTNESGKAPIYYQLGCIKFNQGEYQEALSSHKAALTIRQQLFPSNHLYFGDSYHRIGIVYYSMGDYPKALIYYEKALAIRQQSFPSNHPDLSHSYSNIGGVHHKMGDYSKALSYYEKALVIRQQSLPSNHPDLGASYNNIGLVYYNMGDYPKALSYYETALAIKQQSLPSTHPHLAISYNNIGLAHYNMGDYSKALSYYEKTLAINQQSLPSNHPHLGDSYNNIGNVYYNMGDYPKALSFHEKALAIKQQSLPFNHPDLAISYNNIGEVYCNMSDYSRALSNYEKALEIRQQSLPSNHPELGSSYNNIGNVYYNMGDYPKALSFHEKALAIKQQSLPFNHPDLAFSYIGIGNVYYSMGDYPKALSFNEKALEIRQQSLPSNHPDLAMSYNNTGLVNENMSNYAKAYSFYERTIQIGEQSLLTNHPNLEQWRKNLENIKKKL